MRRSNLVCGTRELTQKAGAEFAERYTVVVVDETDERDEIPSPN